MQIKRTKLADADLIDLFVYGAQQFGESKAEAYFRDIGKAQQFWLKILLRVMSVQNSNRLSVFTHTKDT